MLIKSIKEITKEQFKCLQKYNVKELYSYIENEARNSPFNPAGYGFFNPKILKEDDKYFVVWEHYDSCD